MLTSMRLSSSPEHTSMSSPPPSSDETLSTCRQQDTLIIRTTIRSIYSVQWVWSHLDVIGWSTVVQHDWRLISRNIFNLWLIAGSH